MSGMPNLSALKSMIAQAMQDRMPNEFSRSKAAGKLDAILADRAQAAMETYQQIVANGEPQVESIRDLSGQMTQAEQIRRQAVETALSQATEFPQEQQSRSEQTEA